MRHESADSIEASGLRPAWAGYKTAACICSTEQQTLASRRRPYKNDASGNSPRSSGVRSSKRIDCALTVGAERRPLRTICEILSVSHSNLGVKSKRPAEWVDRRKTPVLNDMPLVTELRELPADLPAYGYRRAWALLRRSREVLGKRRVNAKRAPRELNSKSWT